MAKEKFIIGVDFGATYVKMARLSFDGIIVEKRSFQTSDFPKRKGLICEIIKQIRSLIGKDIKSIAGVGVGVCGQVDYQKGVIHNLTNVKGWKKVPLRQILEKELCLRVYIDNDANVACLGEMEWGAAKGNRNIVCVTLGTGVGGGIIIDGKIYRGSNYSGGEIGHIIIEKNGPRCNCGSRGCLETFVGNHYIVRDVVNRLKKGKSSIITRIVGGSYNKITPKVISEAARRGDRFSIRIWREVGNNIGIGLASIVNLLNPEVIVIGGGISKTGKVLFDAIRRTVRQKALDISVRYLRIVKAKFVDNAGVVGACALVKMELKRKKT